MLKQLARYTTSLLDAGSGLVLIGVTDLQRDVLARTGIGQRIGDANLLAPATPTSTAASNKPPSGAGRYSSTSKVANTRRQPQRHRGRRM